MAQRIAMDGRQLRDNLERVEERIARACTRARRTRSEVKLVAVTKTVSAQVAGLLLDAGIRDFGENRPQELWRKAEQLKNARWHLIGHLQRNKVERTLPLVSLIHSVDSERVLRAIDESASAPIDVLLEVNVAGETTKGGFTLEAALRLAPAVNTLKNVRVRGLMTMAPLQDAELCRPTFAALRKLRDQLQEDCAGHRLEHLSMGMSNDFEVAIEEGATLIRVGTALFEGVGP